MPQHTARAPVQSRALRTRAALLEAAARDFDERGYAQTTTKSIADRAGVASGSFYQYFADKDAVLRELAQARMHGLRARIEAALAARPSTSASPETVEQTYRKAVRAMVNEIIDYHRRDTGLHAVLSERRHADSLLGAMTSASERSSLANIEAGLAGFGCQGDGKALAFVIFGMIEGSVHGHVLGTRVVSDRRLVAALSDAVVELVRAAIPRPVVPNGGR